ncbi:hypothetical protein AK830_g7966 [Neonectria ditissima]|uniref:Uncharacterized protein n=1 Tax=Neonectria ditissima TaxID=78410 RepID=A0A0P7BDP2_9HYPO|nr:hypothetical protein AK830_g7966 [Neonectria ditissima]
MKVTLQLPTPAATNHSYQVYDAQISRGRLERCGFEPSVTSKSPDEIVKDWHEFAELCLKRPTRAEYVACKCYAKGTYTYSRVLTTLSKDRITLMPNTLPTNIRAAFFGWQPYGVAIAEQVASDGYKSLESFAIATPQDWATMATAMSLYDFPKHAFRDAPKGSVLLVLNPEYTTDEERIEDRVAGTMHQQVHERVLELITSMHQEAGTTPPFWAPSLYDGSYSQAKPTTLPGMEDTFSQTTVAMVRSLPHIEGLSEMVNDLEPFNDITNRPYAQTALDGLFKLLGNILTRRKTIRVLHLMNTPMLDSRVVAIILRSCPNVTMLGIYDCPMIGFGDVICLLDLISEINADREFKNQLKIEKFDFFPHFKFGTPYSTVGAATYGITWSGSNGEVAQRGIFRILLEANLKARQMNIGLLFDEDKAFRKYLSQLPLLPLAVECFLDGVHRYCKASQTDQGVARNRFDLREAMYDLLKAVRLGMEDLRHDWPDWYGCQMGKNLVFCSSCGYDMPEEFFTNSAREARPYTRVCAGCMLRYTMETEDEHQKPEHFDILTSIFPNWMGDRFNQDAPLDPAAEGLFRLRTTKSIRPPPPPLQINAAGHVFQPQFEHPLVRDNKYSRDSLEMLPSLGRLLHHTFDEIRERAMISALSSDVNRITTQLLSEFYSKPTGQLPALAQLRADGAKPSHMDEAQALQPGPLYFGFENAKFVFEHADKCGF